MNKHKKLARNTIRARKAIKKRADEQTNQTRCKRWQSRLFALVGCLLLVSALVAPCFADWNTPTEKPIVDFTVDVHYQNAGQVEVSLNGYYEIQITSYGDDLTPGSVLLQSNSNYEIIALHVISGDYVEAKSVSVRGYEYGFQIEVDYYTTPSEMGGATSNIYSDIEGFIFYVKEYPADGMDVDVWSQLGYTVHKITTPFKVNKFFDVADNVFSWISTALSSVQSVFYQNGSLTLLGTLAIIGVSVALGWLVIGIATRFLQLRG